MSEIEQYDEMTPQDQLNFIKQEEENNNNQLFEKNEFDDHKALELAYKKFFNKEEKFFRVDMDTSRLNNTIEYIGESLKYKEAQIDNMQESMERLISQVTDNIQSLTYLNKFVAQMSSMNLVDKMKELNAFSDLGERLEMIKEMRKDVDVLQEKNEYLQQKTDKEFKSVRMDIAVVVDKIDLLKEVVDRQTETIDTHKLDAESHHKNYDVALNNLKQRLDQEKKTMSVMQSNANSNPSFKLDDIFKDARFKKFEELDTFVRERFADIEYKIKHIDINTLDTSEFVKSHIFDQSFRKVYEEMEDIKQSSLNIKDSFRSYTTKSEVLDFIKKGVLYHVNNDIKWEGVDNLQSMLKVQFNMWQSMIMREIEDDEDDDRPTHTMDDSMMRNLMSKQADQNEQMKQMLAKEKEEQAQKLNQVQQQLAMSNEKALSQLMNLENDLPDKEKVDELMRKQKEQNDQLDELMKADKHSDSRVIDELLEKQQEQAGQISSLIAQLERVKKNKLSLKADSQVEQQNQVRRDEIQSELELVKEQNELLKQQLLINEKTRNKMEKLEKESKKMESERGEAKTPDPLMENSTERKIPKKKMGQFKEELKGIQGKLGELEIKFDFVLNLDDFNIYYNDILRKMDNKVDKVEVTDIVDQTQVLKSMINAMDATQHELKDKQTKLLEETQIIQEKNNELEEFTDQLQEQIDNLPVGGGSGGIEEREEQEEHTPKNTPKNEEKKEEKQVERLESQSVNQRRASAMPDDNKKETKPEERPDLKKQTQSIPNAVEKKKTLEFKKDDKNSKTPTPTVGRNARKQVEIKEVKVIEKVGMTEEEKTKMKTEIMEAQKKAQIDARLQLQTMEETVKLMKKDIEDYKKQNKLVQTDIESSLKQKCAIGKLEEVHNEILTELKRHELNFENRLNETTQQLSNTNPGGISKEFMDEIMKKLENIKESDMQREDRQARNHMDENNRKRMHIKEKYKTQQKNFMKSLNYNWNGKPSIKPHYLPQLSGKSQQNIANQANKLKSHAEQERIRMNEQQDFRSKMNRVERKGWVKSPKRRRHPVHQNVNHFRVKDPEEVYNKQVEFVRNHNSVLNVNQAKIAEKDEQSKEEANKSIYNNINHNDSTSSNVMMVKRNL